MKENSDIQPTEAEEVETMNQVVDSPMDAIKEASVEDLMDTESMNEKSAQAVYEFFHKGNAGE